MNSIIGALRVIFGADTVALEEGIGDAQKKMNRVGRDFAKLGGQLEAAGTRMSVGLTAPFLALGVASFNAAKESQAAAAQVSAALASMGGASGKTAEQLNRAAAELQSLSTFDDDDILKKVTANLLTFGNVSGDAFDRAQLAAVNLSTRLGQDLQSSALMVGKALNDPVNGLSALRRVGIQFTEDQAGMIKAMAETGDIAGAQAVMLGELERQFGGAAKAARDATPGADAIDAWREFQETVGAVVIEVLPPLTQLLTQVLNGFNSLDPGLQTFIVGAAAVTAAVGPILLGLGGLISTVGALLPVIASLSTALMGLIIAGGPITLIAAAVAGLVVVFANWDTIGPIVGKMVEAVRQWLTGKLKDVLDWVIDKVGAVGRAFYELYDKVVGHSWIPDLIKGIGRWMAKLGQVMVAPALAANDNVATAFEETADRVAGAVDGMIGAIKNGDWSGAVRQASEAIRQIQIAYDQMGPGGAAGAGAGAIAPYTKGVTRSTLSGVAAGAQLGGMIGGPIGAGIGAVVGGIAGFFGGKSKKKREAEERRQAELQRQAEIALAKANERRSLEVALLRAQGKEQEALNLERDIALEGMFEENRAKQREIWALQDAAAAAADAADAANAAAEAAQAFADQLQTLADQRLADAQDRVGEAEGVLRDAYARESEALRDLASRHRDYAKGLREYAQSLSPTAATVQGALAAFRATLTRALGGGEGSEQAFGDLQRTSEAYLSVARTSAKSMGDLRRAQAQVRVANLRAADAAEATATTADQELARLDAQIGQLIAINDNVVTVADAIVSLTAAIGARDAAQAQAAGVSRALAGGYNFASYVLQNGDLLSAAIAQANAAGTILDDAFLGAFGKQHYMDWGFNEGRPLPGFAAGGVAEVGGFGGVDSQLMRLRATPGEFVSVSHGDPMDGVRGLAAAVRGDSDVNRQLLLKIEENTYQLLKLETVRDRNGVFVRGREPDDPVEIVDAA